MNKILSSCRYNFGLLILLFVFFIYLFVLFKMQIGSHLVYNEEANVFLSRIEKISAPRGEILDINSNILANNITTFSLKISLQQYYKMSLGKRKSMINFLSKTLSIDKDKIFSKIEAPGEYLKDVEIIEINPEMLFKIAEKRNYYPALIWSHSFKRNYLIDDSYAHVIGYVGKINQKELRIFYDVKDYDNNSTIGKLGVEKVYDRYIRGKEGLVAYKVDSKERKIDDGVKIESMVPGDNVVLNIDKNIQDLVKSAIGKKYGTAIVLKPSDGRVLALYNYPYYAMNDVYSKEERDDYSFLNRAIQSSYPAASIFKLVLTAAILEEKVFDIHRKINCYGYFKVGNRIFRCWKSNGHGYVDLQDAVAHSCNVYFYYIGLKYIGIDNIVKYAQDFGLGKKTEIDLPNEVSGLIPTPKWKEKNFHQPWVGGDTVNTSIGQGFVSITPIQIVNMVAMIANEGIVYKPRVVNKILKGDTGKILLQNRPEVLRKSNFISKYTFKLIKKYMRGVVTYGTARYVIISKVVKIIGKTGTGQTGVPGLENSSFVALAPYNANAKSKDQIVVFALIEAKSNSNWWPPKATDIIMQGIFAKQNYDDILKIYKPWYLRN